MRKLLLGSVIAVVLAGAAVALAAVSRHDKWTLSAAVSPSAAGTAAKPIPVAASFTMSETADPGLRPSTASGIDWKWTGVYENGGAFPKCSQAAVIAQKSNSVCPRTSIVATLILVAKLGPEGDSAPNDTLAASATCTKSTDIYNAGAGKAFWWVYGPGSACAGVGYLPPIPMTWTKTSSGSEAVFPIPANISHPLPGIEGGFVSLTNVKFKKLTKRVHGKTVGYLQSICKKGSKRTFSLTSGDPAPQGTVTTTIKLGKCS
jgi:hypothetical protein